jgi:hypothetical protein
LSVDRGVGRAGVEPAALCLRATCQWRYWGGSAPVTSQASWDVGGLPVSLPRASDRGEEVIELGELPLAFRPPPYLFDIDLILLDYH